MKRILVIVGLISSLFFLRASVGWCEETMHHHEHGMASEQHADIKNVGNKICPVMDAPIKEGAEIKYEHEGKEYNFCCTGCIEAFKKDPQKYVKKVEEELKSQTR